MDIIKLIGVGLVEYPCYLFSSNYNYSRFWNKCIRINILYTKVLQAVAVQYVSKNLYYNFNNIPYEYDEISPIEHLTPTNIIGSGMISIVLEGVDKKGNTYVVKTKRKNIDTKIIQGLQQIKNILYWLNYLPYMYVFNLDFLFNHFEKMMIDQLSFENEINNHKKFKSNVAYNTNIIVPDLLEEYCTSTQIVMNKIKGSHYTCVSKELGNKYANQLIEMNCKNLLLDGFVHSDLHAGNIIFTEDNKMCIIDFGLMIQLSAKDRQTFYQLATYFAIHDFDNTIKLFISELLGPDDVKQLLTTTQLNELKEYIIKIVYSVCIVDKKFTFHDIHAIIRVVNKYKLNISSICYHLMLFIVSGESLMKELSPDYMSFFIDKLKILSEFEFQE